MGLGEVSSGPCLSVLERELQDFGFGNVTAGECVHINCHFSPVAKLLDLQGALWARNCGSSSHIWPVGWRLSTPALNNYGCNIMLTVPFTSEQQGQCKEA